VSQACRVSLFLSVARAFSFLLLLCRSLGARARARPCPQAPGGPIPPGAVLMFQGADRASRSRLERQVGAVSRTLPPHDSPRLQPRMRVDDRGGAHPQEIPSSSGALLMSGITGALVCSHGFLVFAVAIPTRTPAGTWMPSRTRTRAPRPPDAQTHAQCTRWRRCLGHLARSRYDYRRSSTAASGRRRQR